MEFKVRKGIDYVLKGSTNCCKFMITDKQVELTVTNLYGAIIQRSYFPLFNIENRDKIASALGVDKSLISISSRFYAISGGNHPELSFRIVKAASSKGSIIMYSAYGNNHQIPTRKNFSQYSALLEDCEAIYTKLFEG